MLTICSQLRCIDSCRVNAVAASCAVRVAIVTVTSVSIAVAIASPLALDTWRNRLVSALRSSKGDPSPWDLDWRVYWYVYVSPSMLTFLRCLGSSGVAISRVSGESCVLDPIRRVLTRSASYPAVSVSFPTQYACLRTLDPSARLPLPSGTSGVRFAVSIGELSCFCSFCGILTVSVAFTVVVVSFPTQYASVRTLDASAWSPKPFGSSGAHLGL